MIEGYECLAIVMVCFQQIFEKNLEFTSEVWVIFTFLWVLAPSVHDILAADFCVSQA